MFYFVSPDGDPGPACMGSKSLICQFGWQTNGFEQTDALILPSLHHHDKSHKLKDKVDAQRETDMTH
jgi:hypothetical protein